MLYIGVDLGTSAVKLLLMDENGNIQKIVSKEYPLYFPKPGWSEQHPEDWYIKSIGGKVAILTFHSGEDRLVKHAFKYGKKVGIYSDVADRKSVV